MFTSDTNTEGKIYTFYSYKGGTGRTMAIANMGVLLARESKFRTLIIDWDLEAPGLHRYLKPYMCAFPNNLDLKTTPGVIDYFERISDMAKERNQADKTESTTNEILDSIKLEDYIIRTEIQNLYFMKAGCFDEGYARRINEFKWQELFHDLPMIYERFGAKLTKSFDYILIDSRTGVTDTSGICTMILPEKLILIFTPNAQSLGGVADIGRSAAEFRLASANYNPLKIYPLPSRIEIAEKDLREQWRKGNLSKNIDGYQFVFERLFEEVYDLEDIDFTNYFDEIQIQHEPRFSYGEEIAVINNTYSDRLSMAESYNKFLNKLLSDDCIWDYKKFPKNNNLPVNIEPIGRERELRDIMDGINSRYPILSIEGPAGIGKSIIALEIGHRCITKSGNTIFKSASFEYVIWISSKNKAEQKRSLNEVFNIIADVMGYTRITQQPKGEINLKDQGVEDLLRIHKTLIIINNFEQVDDADPEDKRLIEWIKRVPEPSKILITNRKNSPLIPSLSYQLTGLNTSDAVKLLNEHAIKLNFDLDKLNWEQKLELVRASTGNPKILELLLSIIKSGVVEIKTIYHSLDSMEATGVLTYLHEEIWKHLTENAKDILKSFPLFGDTRSIEENSLRSASGISEQDFKLALQELFKWSLIKNVFERRYFIHPITKEIIRIKLQDDPNFERAARIRWSNYYLEFISSSVVRSQPDDPYWNVLVSDNMTKLDPDWPSANEVLKWADETGKDELLLKLVTLLVHYMDSRFYNLERLHYVERAIEAARRSGCKYEEALLRVDALGWTYVEENKPEEAKKQIEEGIKVAENLDASYTRKKNELKALGYAWMARCEIEQEKDKLELAVSLIGKALKYANLSPWITFRIYMAAGDIDLKQDKFERALHYYESAKKQLLSYGGEGDNYQINPRIGIASLRIGKIEKAENLFKKLLSLETIPIGRLYGEYGIALVSFIRGDIDNARRMSRSVKEELKRGTTSNLLLNLIENIEADIIKNVNQFQQIKV